MLLRAATEEEMLTSSSYTLSGSPQSCAYCHRPFPSVDGHRQAFHGRAAPGYFCDAQCAEALLVAQVALSGSGRRAA
jgi:hypothetical protein